MAAPINYEKEVLPFLKDNCIACHNKTTTKAGLNMETPELMTKGGESGKGIEAGAGAKSLIFQAAAGDWDSEMPPKTNKVGAVALDEKELALLKTWIDEGAHHAGRQEKVIAWEPLSAAFAPIFASAVSPDGSFAAAARGNQVSIYHVPTGRLVTRLTDEALVKSGLYKNPGVAHRDIVPALMFTADGQRVLTGSYREVKVWKRGESTPRAVTAPPSKVTEAGRFKLVAGAAGDGVSLVEQATNKPLRDLKHGSAVSAFGLSADEQRIATAGADHKIKIWETATGKLMLEITSDAEADRLFAEKSDDHARAGVETVWQNEMIKKAEKEVTDLTARLKKANELAELAKKSLEDKRKDSTAKEAAKAAAEKAAQEVDAEIAKLAAGTKPDEALTKKQTEARVKAEKAVSDAKTAQEGLKRAEEAITDTADEIKVVTEASAKAGQSVTATKAAAEAAKKAQDAAVAAKAEADKARASAIPALKALAFSPDGSQLAASDGGNVVRFWSTVTGRAARSVTVSDAGVIASLVWPSDEGCIVIGDKGSLLIPDVSRTGWTLDRTFGSGDGKSAITDRVNALALSPDGRMLAVGSGEPSRSGDITLWDMTSGKMTAHYDERHLDTVLSLDFSPDGKHLASGGADKAMRITEVSSGKMVKLFEGHIHHVLGVSWRADGRVLSSSGADNVVKVWDWTTGERRKNVDGWDKEVTALRYLGGSDLAATTSGDGKIRVIDSNGAQVKLLEGAKDFMNTLSATKAGNVLVAGGEDGVLHVWDVGTGKVIGKFGK
ncbi:MAG: c-type cytochrome domain-containing protein [Verrucomicrobiota bacterium]